jgi:hypothetical protein
MITRIPRGLTFGFCGLLLSSVVAEEPDPWPRTFRSGPAKAITAAAPEGSAFAYETASFRILSDDRIDPARLEKFAGIAESVPQVLKAVPLSLWAPPPGEKHPIMLCRDARSYKALGGPAGSAGRYDWRTRRVLIRADLFFLPNADGNLLVHELTHLGMHDLLWRTPPWFFEGIAEYIAAAHRGGGAYDFSRMDAFIGDRIRRYLPPADGAAIVLPSLESVVAATEEKWDEENKNPDASAVYRPYAAALLLIHYNLHGKERLQAVQDYLTAAHAYRSRRQARPVLDMGPLVEIEKRLVKFWRTKGLAIAFESP